MKNTLLGSLRALAARLLVLCDVLLFRPKHVGPNRKVAFHAVPPRGFTAEQVLDRQRNAGLADVAGKTVLVAGCGGVGSAIADILARCGVSLLLVDFDVLDATNLNRGAHSRTWIGVNKAVALALHLSRTTASGSRITAVCSDLESVLATSPAKPDVLLIAVDDDAVRCTACDWAMREQVPVVSVGLDVQARLGYVAHFAASTASAESGCIVCLLDAMNIEAEAMPEGEGGCNAASRADLVALAGARTANRTLQLLQGTEPKSQLELFYRDAAPTAIERIARRGECAVCGTLPTQEQPEALHSAMPPEQKADHGDDPLTGFWFTGRKVD